MNQANPITPEERAAWRRLASQKGVPRTTPKFWQTPLGLLLTALAVALSLAVFASL